MTSDRVLRVVDFVAWVAALSGAVVVVAGTPALLIGGLPAVKQFLFVVGILMFGYASFAIQPERPHRDGQMVTASRDTESEFEARLQDTLPVEERLPYDKRVSRDTKLFVSSIVVLVVSLLLELGLGVPG
ncbi:DUF7555 family protein [Haloglomus litoreum]|uniref:DUF7555 family protein n=1 Tax=Haloglomus litoreum TaxID=3034026 RepID=UPI0023E79396|nr:hypothetical protein [Haloglomus sp. DT116]